MPLLQRLMEDESGASHLEYAIIAAFTGALLTGSLIVLKGGLETFYTDLAGLLNGIL